MCNLNRNVQYFAYNRTCIWMLRLENLKTSLYFSSKLNTIAAMYFREDWLKSQYGSPYQYDLELIIEESDWFCSVQACRKSSQSTALFFSGEPLLFVHLCSWVILSTIEMWSPNMKHHLNSTKLWWCGCTACPGDRNHQGIKNRPSLDMERAGVRRHSSRT